MHRPSKRVRVSDSEWDQRKYQIVDNADRMRASPIVEDVPRADLLRGDAPARNLMVRVNQLRTTGNPRVARLLRSEKQPVYRDLFWNDTWDASRGVYHCANCGKYATPSQLGSWYNPGLSNTDLALTMPLFDAMDQPDRQSRARATVPYDLFEPSHEVQFLGNRRVVVPKSSSERNMPPTFVCSKSCYDEQMRYNQYRSSAYYNYRERVDNPDIQTVPPSHRDRFLAAERHGGRIPRGIKEKTLDSLLSFDDGE